MFSYAAQLNTRSVAKNIKVGSVIDSNGLSRILKSAPLGTFFLYFLFALPQSYEKAKCPDVRPQVTVLNLALVTLKFTLICSMI